MEAVKKAKNRQIWIWVFIAFFLAFGVRLLFEVKGDFNIYYNSIRMSLEGSPEKAYTQKGDGFVYMPFAYMIMRPMGLFPVKVSRILHHIIESSLLMITCLMIFNLTLPGGKRMPYLLGVTLILISRFLHNNFGYGQMNIIILFSIIAALFYFHRGRLLPAALFLAIAISFKITPLVFVFYFLLRREYRFAFYTLIAVFLLNFILPFISWGLDGGISIYRAWVYSQFKLGSLNITKLSNYSLLSALFRYLTDYSWYDKPGYFMVNIMSLSRSGIAVIYSGCVVLMLGLFAGKCGKPLKVLRSSHAGENLFLVMLPEYSLVIIAMLLFSPISWQHHFVLLFVPYFYITYYLLKNGAQKNKLVLRLVVASFVIGGLTTPVFMGVNFSRALMSYSAITFSALLLLVAVLKTMGRRIPGK